MGEKPKKTNAEGLNTTNTSDKKDSKNRNKTFQNIGAGAVGGILLGAAGTLLVSKAINSNSENETETVDGNATDTENLDYSAENQNTNEDVEVAEVENADSGISFADAFAAAHDAAPGSYFEWNGNVYLAYTEDEWNNMTPDDQTNYSNLAIQDYNSNYQSSEPYYSDFHSQSAPDYYSAPSTAPQSGFQNNAGGNNDEIDYTAENQNQNNITAENAPEPAAPEVPLEELDYTSGAGNNAPASEEADNNNIVAEHSTNENSDDQSEIEVLGVYHDDEDNSNVGGILVDNQEVYLIDVDNNQVFDYAAVDKNNDEEFQDDEIIDIQEENLTVNDLQQAAGQAATPDDNLLASNGNSDGMADYVNNADDVYEA